MMGKLGLVLISALFLEGFAHIVCLGFHGNSVKAYPEIHPDFTGCRKCHNG